MKGVESGTIPWAGSEMIKHRGYKLVYTVRFDKTVAVHFPGGKTYDLSALLGAVPPVRWRGRK